MNPFRMLSAFLVTSAIFLAIGAIILRIEDLVPLSLTYSTFVAIVIILAVAYYTWKEIFSAASTGVVLATVSILLNTFQPAHTSAILHPFGTVPYTILVMSDLAGFYLLPALYIILYLVRYRKLRTFSALTQLQSMR